MSFLRHDVVNMQVFPSLAGLTDGVEPQFCRSDLEPARSVIPVRGFPSLDAGLSFGERIESLDAVCHVVSS